MKIAVVGAGAIGGIIGGVLSEEGEDIVLIDVDKDHVKAINEKGIKIDGARGELNVKVPALLPNEVKETYDLIFFVVKATQTEDALKTSKNFLKDDSVLVCLQNGINEDYIALIIGERRTIGGLVGWGAENKGPGYLTQDSRGDFTIGELDGSITDRVKKIADILGKVEPVVISENIWGHLWTKLLVNSSMSAIGAVTGYTYGETLKDDLAKRLVVKVMTEIVDVAQALGIKMEPISGVDPVIVTAKDEEKYQQVSAILDAVYAPHANVKTGALLDYKRGVKTEIGCWNGYVVEKAKEARVKVPVNSAIVGMVGEIENKKRKLTPENIKEIENLARFKLS